MPSSTALRGSFSLRVAITNHRSTGEDFALLVREIVRRGDALAEGSRAQCA